MAAPPRLFVASERFLTPEPLRLSGPEHHYLAHVLRLGIGDEVLLLDGGTKVATTRIAGVTPDALELEWLSVEETATAGQSAEPRVTLYMGLCKGEKQDLIVQKATELGAQAIVSVSCKHSVPDLDKDRGEKRRERWQRIATAAAQQCRRPDLPQVTAPMSFAEALRLESSHDGATLRLMLYEGTAPPVRSLLGESQTRIALFIGPEGGLAKTEIDALFTAGFLPCSLGPRILRAETAALAALAVVLSG